MVAKLDAAISATIDKILASNVVRLGGSPTRSVEYV